MFCDFVLWSIMHVKKPLKYRLSFLSDKIDKMADFDLFGQDFLLGYEIAQCQLSVIFNN